MLTLPFLLLIVALVFTLIALTDAKGRHPLAWAVLIVVLLLLVSSTHLPLR